MTAVGNLYAVGYKIPLTVTSFAGTQSYDDQGMMQGLPHVRGGVSLFQSTHELVPWSSPRPLGCF